MYFRGLKNIFVVWKKKNIGKNCIWGTFWTDVAALSLIGSIKILTYRTWGSWGYLPCLFTNCITRSCDLLDWFIQTCIGVTWIDVMTHHWNSSMTWQRDKLFKNVFNIENIIILSLIFILDYRSIMAIKYKYWFFCFAFIHTIFPLVTFAKEYCV